MPEKPTLAPGPLRAIPFLDSGAEERRQFLKLLSLAAGTALLSPAFASTGARAGGGNAGGKRNILITGATDGLGRRLAERLAAPGVTILVHGRDQARAQEVLTSIRDAGGTGQFYRADFSSLAAVAELAEAVSQDHQRLDVLVNNAGIYTGKPGEGRRLSQDGHELCFAVNYLAPFALTRRLLPLLRSSSPARIVNVASAGQNAIDFNDVMLARDYNAQRAYGQSKLALIMFTIDLAQELRGSGVTANSLHPANYMDTAMVRESGIRPWSSVDEGADALLQLINAPELADRTGLYFSGRREARANAQAYDEQARARLRALSIQLTHP